MKEAKKGECQKCGTFFYLHTHHTLPKSIFGKNVPTAEYAPTATRIFTNTAKKKQLTQKIKPKPKKYGNIG